MAKGDDAVARKRNKSQRKKNFKKEGSSSVSARVASIIAAKKRRQSGLRRKCQGMCFSLPTLDDPFNDRHGKKDSKKKISKKSASLVEVTCTLGDAEMDHHDEKNEMVMNVDVDSEALLDSDDDDSGPEVHLDGETKKEIFPSKFLSLCLNSMESWLRKLGLYGNGEDRPLFADDWGLKFLNCYFSGKDVMETSGCSCTTEQIAWMVSVAADTISRKEEEGLSFSSPFLLFLVPSQEKAAEVRSVCKPLKAFGIHTVSLHPGASVDHQTLGLKSCEPEFIVSTPDRIMELISLQAIDVSGVSFLIVDGLESFYTKGFFNALNSIRQLISGHPQTVVFNNYFSCNSALVLENLLFGSICRLSSNDSIPSQGSSILQIVDVCYSEQEKLSKGIQVLHNACENRLSSQPVKVVYIVAKDSVSRNLVKVLKVNGYSVSNGSNGSIFNVVCSPQSDGKRRPAISMIDEDHIDSANLGLFEIIILPNFVLSINHYVQILTRMARHTSNGALHSFLTKEHALLASPLIKILEQCGQVVPEALKDLQQL